MSSEDKSPVPFTSCLSTFEGMLSKCILGRMSANIVCKLLPVCLLSCCLPQQMTASKMLVSEAFKCAADKHICNAVEEKSRKTSGVIGIELHLSRAATTSCGMGMLPALCKTLLMKLLLTSI